MKQDNTEVVFLRLDKETKDRLEKLAGLEDRSNNAELRFLINREYYRIIEPKPELINT